MDNTVNTDKTARVINIVIITVVLVLVGGFIGVLAYSRHQSQMNELTAVGYKAIYFCQSKFHPDDKPVETKRESAVMTRAEAEKLSLVDGSYVKTIHYTCEACKTYEAGERQQAKEEAEEIARLGALQREAAGIYRQIDVAFALAERSQSRFWGGNDDLSQPIQLHPGDPIKLVFFFRNKGTKPIPAGEVKVIVKPVSALMFGDTHDVMNPYYIDEEHANSRQWLEELSKTGISLPQINPANSPYYHGQQEYKFEIADTYHFNGRTNTLLAVRPKIEAGQSFAFSGYVVIKGREYLIASRTLHVMYR